MVAHQKKRFFERKGLQNPPIDKKTTKQKKNKGKYKNKCQNIWWNKIKSSTFAIAFEKQTRVAKWGRL